MKAPLPALPTRAAPEAAAPLLHRILVPLASAESLRALDYAIGLSEQTGASVHLLHVVEPAPVMSGLDSVPIVRDAPAIADEAAAQLAVIAGGRSAPHRPITSAVHIGKPSRKIIAVAEELRSDFLIVATHARTGFSHFLLGSVAEHVLRTAPCPVFIVRQSDTDPIPAPELPKPLRFPRILVPTDFSALANGALDYALRFAREFGGKITLLHLVHTAGLHGTLELRSLQTPAFTEGAVRSAEARLETLRQSCAAPDLIERTEARLGTPLTDIAAYATEHHFDLIACSTHGYSGVKRALLGSAAEALVRHAPCPLLVLGNGVTAPAGEPAS
jgi:nucleotide-binding universal stress UspA family protein